MKKKLEKLMYMGLGALIAFGGYLFGTLHSNNVDAQLAPTDVEYNEIRCRNLKIVDADGKPSIELVPGELRIVDENGQRRVSLVFHDGMGIVSLHGENQQNAVGLVSQSNGDGAVVVFKDGKRAVGLGTNNTGGIMTIGNKGGQVVVQTAVSDIGSGTIVTKDKLGYQTVSLPKGGVSAPND